MRWPSSPFRRPGTQVGLDPGSVNSHIVRIDELTYVFCSDPFWGVVRLENAANRPRGRSIAVLGRSCHSLVESQWCNSPTIRAVVLVRSSMTRVICAGEKP